MSQPKAAGSWWGRMSVLVILCGLGTAQPARADVPAGEVDLEQAHRLIVERYREVFLARARDRLDSVMAHARSLNDQGQWPDLNYQDNRRAAWSPDRHVVRLRSMAVVLNREEQPPAELRQAFERGLRWWLDNDPQAPNWWFNEIGVPASLMAIVALVGDDLPDDLRQRALVNMDRAAKRMETHIGDNAISTARIVLMRGAMSNDPAITRKAAERISQSVFIATREGVQPDFSFHAHGAQLYNGGYGAPYITHTAELAYLLHGTPYALSREQLDILANYLIEGQQWMMRGDRMSYSTAGRGGFSRAGWGRLSFVDACRILAALHPDRAEALAVFAARQRGEVDPLVGFKHFWRSDFSVHHSEDHMLTIKAYSTRVRPSGTGNGENLKGAHLDHGMTLLLRDGREYDGLFAAWDWKYIPGTTTAHDDKLPMRNWAGNFGETDFVGGAGVDHFGLAVLDFRYAPSDDDPPLTARKAWFAFDGAIVAMGAGIAGGGPHRVTTTINQANARGTVTIDGNPQRTIIVPEDAIHELTDTRWVHHDGVGYVVLDDDQGLRLRVGRQSGSWSQINADQRDRPVHRNVFRLWIEHGKSPTSGRYAYVLLPGAEPADAQRFAAQPPLTILTNTPTQQAVYHRDQRVLGVAFYEAGTMKLQQADTPWATVAVDQPALVLLRGGDQPTLTVADPTHRLTEVTVTINGKPHRVTLPQGGHAGQSVTLPLMTK